MDNSSTENTTDHSAVLNDRVLSVIEHELQNKSQEITLKEKELELRKQQDIHSFEFATHSLKEQTKDRQEERNHLLKVRYTTIGLTISLTIIFVVLIFSILYLGYKDIAIEIIKLVGTALITGFGGYHYGKSVKATESKNEPSH